MFISIPILILIVIACAWASKIDSTDRMIEEMRDPGGLKRKALQDYAAATKGAKKHALCWRQEEIDGHMGGLGYDTTSRGYAELVALAAPGCTPSLRYATPAPW